MIKWNNIDLRTKGIIVEKTPKISKGKKNIETYAIDGRSGFLTIDKGTYQSFTVSLECHAREDADFDEIKAFLDGYGTLSFENDREYTAIINNAIPFEKVGIFKRFIIQFLVNPIAKSIQSFEEVISSASYNFTITDANVEMDPTITLVGSGDISITVNNKTFYLYELEAGKTYTLDSEVKEIKDNLGNNVANKMNGNFPTIKPGSNTVEYTGSITSLKFNYKKNYL